MTEEAVRPDLRALLGRRVEVVIDRPLGSRHPHHPDIIYPVNYGYLPNTVSGDGMPIDVYLLGIDEPVMATSGIVTAVVFRDDDVEDKLVVAPDAASYSPAEIASAIAFQEQFFVTRIEARDG